MSKLRGPLTKSDYEKIAIGCAGPSGKILKSPTLAIIDATIHSLARSNIKALEEFAT